MSTIKSVTQKTGRSGDLVFVTVRHEIFDHKGMALGEEHDIVYREAAKTAVEPTTIRAASMNHDWQRMIVPDPVLLFRYSALTFNSHRIHYDIDYATKVEKYPGLIVHGPLLATLLLDGLRRAHPDAIVRTFVFRAMSPIFHIDPFFVCGRMEPERQVSLWAKKDDGSLCMDATATLV